MKSKILYSLILICFFSGKSKLTAQVKNVEIIPIENSDKSIELLYKKKKPGNYTLSLEFSDVENCNVKNFERLISDDSGQIMKLEPLNKNQRINYSIRYYTVLGGVNPKIDSLFRYTLPFKNGKKIKIFEAEYAGEKYFGVKKTADWKSYAVVSNSPDTVCSMRKAIVVMIDNQYSDNSILNAQYTSRRNEVIIEHADGTFAMYKGFKQNEIFVELGQTVSPQTSLGIIEKYNQTSYRLDVNVYYLAENDFNSRKLQSADKSKNVYKYFAPVFYIKEGEMRLESNKEYTVAVDEKIMKQEFSGSEKKNSKKNNDL
jgi:hypothetical protein